MCRWAQPAIEAALALQREHGFAPIDIAAIAHRELPRGDRPWIAVPVPATTDEAQYSLPYPVAAALVFGRVGAREIDAAAATRPSIACCH